MFPTDCLDIANSCFVFASAGSGKTSVLVNRYVKALMSGISPREILCLTFTKAAAFEMESRILATLEKLCLNEDEFARHYLANVIGITDFDDGTLMAAERLFFDFQDDLHNTKITTLHSFCQDLLSKFPLEAGLNSNFEVIDESDASELMKMAKCNAFAALEKTNPESLQDLASLVSGYALEEFTNRILSSPARL
ncbi:MAG: UvrD-helicase domain-containing protein, partial [Holosporales bacterium]|nr:UvrD-helicase domain-containing protein [Holosporales bacterium]